MIGEGFYPLVAGLGVTSALIAYTDFRFREVGIEHFIPAIAGFCVFYALSGDWPLIVVGATTSALMVSSTWATLKYTPAIMRRLGRGKKGEDWSKEIAGDYITVGVFAFWPSMIVGVLMAALLIGIAGKHYDIWNRGVRTIPLAGLIGLVTLAYIVWTALV